MRAHKAHIIGKTQDQKYRRSSLNLAKKLLSVTYIIQCLVSPNDWNFGAHLIPLLEIHFSF